MSRWFLVLLTLLVFSVSGCDDSNTAESDAGDDIIGSDAPADAEQCSAGTVWEPEANACCPTSCSPGDVYCPYAEFCYCCAPNPNDQDVADVVEMPCQSGENWDAVSGCVTTTFGSQGNDPAFGTITSSSMASVDVAETTWKQTHIVLANSETYCSDLPTTCGSTLAGDYNAFELTLYSIEMGAGTYTQGVFSPTQSSDDLLLEISVGYYTDGVETWRQSVYDAELAVDTFEADGLHGLLSFAFEADGPTTTFQVAASPCATLETLLGQNCSG